MSGKQAIFIRSNILFILYTLRRRTCSKLNVNQVVAEIYMFLVCYEPIFFVNFEHVLGREVQSGRTEQLNQLVFFQIWLKNSKVLLIFFENNSVSICDNR